MKNPRKKSKKITTKEVQMTENSKPKYKVERIYKDVHTCEVRVVLSSTFMGKYIEKTIGRDEITPKGLDQLTKYGFPFLSKDEKEAFIDYYFTHEANFCLVNYHTKIGWHTIDGKKCFLLEKALYKGEEQDSVYDGETNILKKGNVNKYKKFFNNKIAFPKLIGIQTLCAVSLSSAIVGMLGNKDLSFIFHIKGVSTSGKTTGLKVASSMWGSPEIVPNGVGKTWNTTINKLVNSSVGNMGVLSALDEFSMVNADSTQIIYLLTGGNDKQRMTGDNNSAEYLTNFLSTGEIQLKDSNFGGVAVRLFEVKGHNFTRDKETADELNEFIKKNYGTVGYQFARRLTLHTEREIHSKMDELSIKIRDRIKFHTENKGKKYSHLFERVADKFATIALSAQIARDEMKMKFDVDAIIDFLICNTTLLELGQEQSVEAIEKFREAYIKNNSKFPKKITEGVGVWGKIVKTGKVVSEVIVLYNQFIKMMKEKGFPESDSLIKSLKEKGFIKCEPGKNYFRRTIGDSKKVKVIVVDALAIEGGINDED